MKGVITGITGFVGSHLADYIVANHPEVELVGLKRWRSPQENIRHLKDKVTFYDYDLRDISSLVNVLRRAKPDVIFHLAAQSFVTTSYDAPIDTLETNVIGTSNLLEAVRICDLDPTIHICSSSEVYGQVTEQDIPIKEDCPLRPVSPYAVSKASVDLMAQMYFKARGLRTIRSRAFTHSGPRRGDVFVDSFYCLQLARIEQGQQERVLKVGNLDSVRTFCDVRDIVRAYWLLVHHCQPGEVYNIGGSTTMTIRDMLKMLLEMSDSDRKIEVEVDPGLLRPADVDLQIPCSTKFKDATKWEPQISYKKTLASMLDYWREQVRNGHV
jgi:GDP-mannose 4,6-dehydratase